MNDLLLSLTLYGLAIAISLGVAAVVKLIVLALGALRPAVRPAPEPAPAAAAEVPPAHVAAIAAALAETIGGHRIVHISQRGHDDGWAHEGRSEHHHSHNLPRVPRR